jgi:hypothetical protein
MGYSMRGTVVRLIDGGKVYQPHEVDELHVDPCSLPSYRYTLRYKRWEKEECRVYLSKVQYAWWEVITSEDSARVRYLKWKLNKDICRQVDIVEHEKRKLRELTR